MKNTSFLTTIVFRISLLLTLLQGTELSAQNNNDPSVSRSREQFYIGAKVGLTRSNVYKSDGGSYATTPKSGVTAGVFFIFPIGKFFGIQQEILYAQRGFNADGNFLGNDYHFKRTLNYIDVPFLATIKPSDFLSIQAGPQFSFLLNQEDVFSTGNFSIQQQQQFDNSNLRRNTICMLVGAELNLHQTVIGFRAGWDVLDNKGDGTSTNPNYKNKWLMVTLGFKFGGSSDK